MKCYKYGDKIPSNLLTYGAISYRGFMPTGLPVAILHSDLPREYLFNKEEVKALYSGADIDFSGWILNHDHPIPEYLKTQSEWKVYGVDIETICTHKLLRNDQLINLYPRPTNKILPEEREEFIRKYGEIFSGEIYNCHPSKLLPYLKTRSALTKLNHPIGEVVALNYWGNKFYNLYLYELNTQKSIKNNTSSSSPHEYLCPKCKNNAQISSRVIYESNQEESYQTDIICHFCGYEKSILACK